MAKVEKVEGLKARVAEQASELPDPVPASPVSTLEAPDLLSLVQPQLSQFEQALEMIGDKVGQLEGIIEKMRPFVSEEGLPKSIVEGVTHTQVYLTALSAMITSVGGNMPVQQLVKTPAHLKNASLAVITFAEEFTKAWLLKCRAHEMSP